MLRSHHGASALGKILRRPFILNMSSFEGTASFATDAMRSTLAAFRGRVLPVATRSPRRTPTRQSQTWHPSHGIVFGTNTVEQVRPFGTTALADADRDLLLHSQAEDNYVLAGGDVPFAVEDPAIKQDSPPGNSASTNPTDPENQDEAYANPPTTTFSYKMDEELFRNARKAAIESPESYWLHTLYRGPSTEGEGKKVLVHYCYSKHTAENVIQRYFMDQEVIGFDIEWKPEANRWSGAKKNVSLIQIASEERVVLIHVALFAKDNDLVAPSLKKILEDPAITKVGVAIKADCTRLRKYLDINAQGLFELSHLYKLVRFSDSKDFKSINKRLVSLAVQVQEHLHLPMFKGEVRGSDWTKKLNTDQVTYAAADAYAGIQLFNVLELKREALDPMPPRPYHADLNKPIRLAEGVELPNDETVEELEPEEAEPTSTPNVKRALSNLPISEVAIDSDADFEPSQEISTPASSSPPTTRSRPPATAKPPKHPSLITAEEHVSTYRASTADSTLTHRATPANLRAYYLWTLNAHLSIPEIAAIMRSPPLQTATVAQYILESVKLESLAYEKERVRNALSIWKKNGGAKGFMAKRYSKLEREVGFGSED